MSLKHAGSDISKQRTKSNSITSNFSSINLSKIKYKDGTICKDSCNSNPGFGLWCIDTAANKTTVSEEMSVVGKHNFNSNLKTTFKSSIAKVLSEYDVPDREAIVESMDTMLISELKVRCDDLERQLADALCKFYDRENRCINAENMQKEYEQLVNENIEQKKALMSRNSQLENHIANLTNALGNAQKEINRLNSIIGGAKREVDVAKEECDRVINEEKEKQVQLKTRITKLEKEIERITLSHQYKRGIVGNANNGDNQMKLFSYSGNGGSGGSSNGCVQKYEYQIKSMTDYILDLQIEIRNLKEKVKTMEEDKKTLKEIIKHKDKKNTYQQQSIDKLHTAIEAKEKDTKWNKRAMQRKEDKIPKLKVQSDSAMHS